MNILCRTKYEYYEPRTQTTYKFSLLHAASSDPSVQSLFWSHIHANGIHSPSLFLQANSSDVHVLCSEKEENIFDFRSVKMNLSKCNATFTECQSIRSI